MDVSHRYDLKQILCVNKEVDKYNRRLQKHTKVFENAEVIKANLDRRGFTKHGQHMNAKGKELMAKRISVAIKYTLKYVKRYQSA
jgi:cellulose biosynthesis protein BcsQ